MIIKPHIKFACQEDWNAMKIGIHSRHCQNCKKDVVDFTAMNRQEILVYLFTNYDKQVCGRAYTSQLDFTHEDLLITVNALSLNPKNTNISFFLLTIGTLLLMSCNKGEKIKHKSAISIAFDEYYGADENVESTTSTDDCSREVMGVMVIEQPQIVIPDTIGTKFYPSDHYNSAPVAHDGEISDVYIIVDEMPEFPGGVSALMSFIKRNIKYPKYEKENKIEETVYATFMIDETGKVNDLEIIPRRFNSSNENFKLEVIRVLSGMPRWKPGKLRGKKVKVQYNLPVKFEL